MKILRRASVVLLLLTCACDSTHAPPPTPAAPPPQAALPPAPPLPAVVEHGKASYYAPSFEGQPTASGAAMDPDALTAASKDLPLGSTAVVTNLKTGKSIAVTVNDRGPYVPGRIVDLSPRAADAIDMQHAGVVPVKVEAKPQDQPTAELKDKVVHTAIAKETAKKHRRVRQAKAKAAHRPGDAGSKPAPQDHGAQKASEKAAENTGSE